jgi:predicted SAM-dependent methyltransferase
MKIHLGCGKRFLQGFIHIDIADFPHIDHNSSVEKLPFISDETVDEIYTSHTFEYFDRVLAAEVLTEWNRILRKGGKLYMTVPNFQSLIEIYTSTSKLENIIGPLFGRWINSSAVPALYHKTVWDQNDLTKYLSAAGFSNICEFNPKDYLQGIDQNFDDYSLAYFPHMDQSGIQVSLAISAQKL